MISLNEPLPCRVLRTRATRSSKVGSSVGSSTACAVSAHAAMHADAASSSGREASAASPGVLSISSSSRFLLLACRLRAAAPGRYRRSVETAVERVHQNVDFCETPGKRRTLTNVKREGPHEAGERPMHEASERPILVTAPMEGRRIAKGEAFRYMGVGMLRTSKLFSVRMLGFGFFWAWLFLVAVSPSPLFGQLTGPGGTPFELWELCFRLLALVAVGGVARQLATTRGVWVLAGAFRRRGGHVHVCRVAELFRLPAPG